MLWGTRALESKLTLLRTLKLCSRVLHTVVWHRQVSTVRTLFSHWWSFMFLGACSAVDQYPCWRGERRGGALIHESASWCRGQRPGTPIYESASWGGQRPGAPIHESASWRFGQRPGAPIHESPSWRWGQRPGAPMDENASWRWGQHTGTLWNTRTGPGSGAPLSTTNIIRFSPMLYIFVIHYKEACVIIIRSIELFA